MTDPKWPLNTELYHYAVVGERYEPRKLGKVIAVGERGVTVRLAEADPFGGTEMRLEFGCPRIWTSETEAREWCEANVGPWEHLRRD